MKRLASIILPRQGLSARRSLVRSEYLKTKYLKIVIGLLCTLAIVQLIVTSAHELPAETTIPSSHNSASVNSQDSQTSGQLSKLGTTDNPSIPGSWNLLFSDTFQSTSLDSSKWNTCYWWTTTGGCTNAGNSELEWYQPDDVIPTVGLLRLKTEQRIVNNYPYTSGMVTTFGKFAFQYGYMEAKMKVPAGKGLWPAFWTLPTVKNM